MKLKTALIIFLCLSLAFSGYVVYLQKQIVNLKDELVKVKEAEVKAKEEAEKVIKEKEEVLEKYKAQQKELEEKSKELSQQQTELDKKADQLEKQFVELTDKNAMIANLQEQVKLWKEKFSLAQKELANKDEIIFNLTNQYNVQLDLTNQYKNKYELELASRLRLEATFREIYNTNKSTNFMAKINLVALAAIAAICVFTK